MTALLIASLLLRSDTAPLMPSGTSAEFQATAYKVETLIAGSKFEEAGALIKRLPSKSLSLQWDDSAVPAELKSAYADSRDAAIADWCKGVPGLSVKLAPKGDIRVSFKDTLPPPVDSVLPAGGVFFTSDDPADPRVEAVVALKRENPPVAIDPRNVQNEVGYAIGSYLGLARLPRPVGYMGRMDTISRLELHVNPREIGIVRDVFDFVEVLRTAIEKKTPLETTKPQMFLNPAVVEAKDAHQGDAILSSIEVTNRGNAPLRLRGFTECGCLSVAIPEEVRPGESGLIQIRVDTTQVAGKFEKSFVIYSNDPDIADRRVVVKAWVEPSYRFLRPSGSGPIVVSEGGLKDDVYLTIDPERPFKVTNVTVQGLKVVSSFEPWEGELADPNLGQGSAHRKGYKISFLASPTANPGRIPMTIAVATDNKDFPVVYNTIYVQWGIVALPEELYFGEVTKSNAVGFFIVSRPGQPFKILSATCDSKYVSLKAEPFRDGEYRVNCVILPQVPYGRLDATITLKTDDPKQPKVTVPLLAIIK